MNKLKWFTHDNDALEDEWSQALIDHFGFEGYGRWWALLEMFDRHGSGETWKTTWPFILRKLRGKRVAIDRLLAWCGLHSRLVARSHGYQLEIEIPKFRKKQSKLKSKVRSILPKKEKEKKKENTGTKVPVEKTARARARKVKHEMADIRKVVDHYISVKGWAGTPTAKAGEGGGWPRWIKEADGLLGQLYGRVELAVEIVSERGREWENMSWTLAAVVRTAPEWLAEKQAKAAKRR